MTKYLALILLAISTAYAQSSVPTPTCGSLTHRRHLWADPATAQGHTDYCLTLKSQQPKWAMTFYGNEDDWNKGIHRLVVAVMTGSGQTFAYVDLRLGWLEPVTIGGNSLVIYVNDYGRRADGRLWANFEWEGYSAK